MLLKDVKIGREYYTRISGELVLVEVVRQQTTTSRTGRVSTKFVVMRGDNKKVLPKARAAAALHRTKRYPEAFGDDVVDPDHEIAERVAKPLKKPKAPTVPITLAGGVPKPAPKGQVWAGTLPGVEPVLLRIAAGGDKAAWIITRTGGGASVEYRLTHRKSGMSAGTVKDLSEGRAVIKVLNSDPQFDELATKSARGEPADLTIVKRAIDQAKAGTFGKSLEALKGHEQTRRLHDDLKHAERQLNRTGLKKDYPEEYRRLAKRLQDERIKVAAWQKSGRELGHSEFMDALARIVMINDDRKRAFDEMAKIHESQRKAKLSVPANWKVIPSSLSGNARFLSADSAWAIEVIASGEALLWETFNSGASLDWEKEGYYPNIERAVAAWRMLAEDPSLKKHPKGWREAIVKAAKLGAKDGAAWKPNVPFPQKPKSSYDVAIQVGAPETEHERLAYEAYRKAFEEARTKAQEASKAEHEKTVAAIRTAHVKGLGLKIGKRGDNFDNAEAAFMQHFKTRSFPSGEDQKALLEGWKQGQAEKHREARRQGRREDRGGKPSNNGGQFHCWRAGADGRADYVTETPGKGGHDWGYTFDALKALPLSDYWRKRFEKEMRHLGARTGCVRLAETPPKTMAPKASKTPTVQEARTKAQWHEDTAKTLPAGATDETERIIGDLKWALSGGGVAPQNLRGRVKPIPVADSPLRKKTLAKWNGKRLGFVSKAPIYDDSFKNIKAAEHKALLGLIMGRALRIYQVPGPLPGEHRPSRVGAHADSHYLLMKAGARSSEISEPAARRILETKQRFATATIENVDILDESVNVKAALRSAGGERIATPGYTSASDRLDRLGLTEASSGALTDKGRDAYKRLVAFEGKAKKTLGKYETSTKKFDEAMTRTAKELDATARQAEAKKFQAAASKGLKAGARSSEISEPAEDRGVKGPAKIAASLTTLADGRVFPSYKGGTLSWDIGLYMTPAESAHGYPRAKAVIAAMAKERPEQLAREKREMRKAQFDRMFGHNAKEVLGLIEAYEGKPAKGAPSATIEGSKAPTMPAKKFQAAAAKGLKGGAKNPPPPPKRATPKVNKPSTSGTPRARKAAAKKREKCAPKQEGCILVREHWRHMAKKKLAKKASS